MEAAIQSQTLPQGQAPSTPERETPFKKYVVQALACHRPAFTPRPLKHAQQTRQRLNPRYSEFYSSDQVHPFQSGSNFTQLGRNLDNP